MYQSSGLFARDILRILLCKRRNDLNPVGLVTGCTVLDRHCGARRHPLTSPVGNVSACSSKGRHYNSKRPSFLTPLDPRCLLQCCSYAFNNAFLSQGNLVLGLLPWMFYLRHTAEQSCDTAVSHSGILGSYYMGIPINI